MKAIFGRFVAGAIVAVTTAFFAGAPAAAQQQFTMKISSPTINDVVYQWMKTVKAGIEKSSGGRIKVELYPANQLGQLPVVVDGVAIGTIEAANTAAGFLVGLDPRFQVFDVPGLFTNVEQALRVIDDPAIKARLSTFGVEKGFQILSVCVYSPMMLLSHKPVRTVADARGLKVRMPGGAPIQIEPFRKIGMLPVSIPLGEALPALQNHTIDGLVAGMSVFTAFKYYDVAKSLTYLPETFLIAPFVVNTKWLKSLGPELEGIVLQEAKKADALYGTFGVNGIRQAEETWRAHNGELIKLPPAEAKHYLDVVTSVVPGIVNKNPKLKADYEAFVAASKKYRQ